jgi:hypothetical protein
MAVLAVTEESTTASVPTPLLSPSTYAPPPPKAAEFALMAEPRTTMTNAFAATKMPPPYSAALLPVILD